MSYINFIILIICLSVLVAMYYKTKFITIWKEKFTPKNFKLYEDKINYLLDSEKKLKAELELMRIGEKIMNAGTWTWDMTKEPDEVLASENFAKIFEITVGEPVTARHLIEVVHYDDRHTVNKILEQAFETGLPYDMEYRIVLKNKRNDLIQVKGEPIPNDVGKTVKIIGIIKLIKKDVD